MTFYRRVLLTLAVPFTLGVLCLRLLRRSETRADLAERLGGRAASGAARGPVVWLHGASVGEVTALRGLAERLLARDRRLSLVLTANTVTGRAAVRAWGMARVSARLAPLDTRRAVARFLSGWQPVALVQAEKEYWPNRMVLAKGRRMAVMQAAAQLSARSAAAWARLPSLAEQVLSTLDHVAAQDAASEARLLALGLPHDRLGARMNLKAAARPADPDPAELAALAAVFPRGHTILAASTHAGEEEIVLAAFRKAREFDNRLRLILAPRHPDRGDEVAGRIARAGQTTARRSAGGRPDAATAVYLADTLGEMGLWYRLAGTAFVGGSLVDLGGHTPYEPARLGCAILHGPHVGNNADAYRLLRTHRAAVEVRDAGSLTAEILRLSGNARLRGAMVDRARRALDQTGQGGDGIDAFVVRLGELTRNPRPVA